MGIIVIFLFVLLVFWSVLKVADKPSPPPEKPNNELLGRTDPAPVRRAMEEHRRAFPFCASCGRSPVEIHHIIPVGVDPRQADDLANLISFCPECHIAYGHGGDPGCKRYVPNVQRILRLRVVVKI